MILSPLNAIVDVDVAERAGWAPLDLAAAYVEGGARFLQIRAKSLSGAAFLDLSTRICEMAHGARAIVIVNDRADVARLSGADGIHVGQEDLRPEAVRRIVGAEAIVGLSTHTNAQVDAAIGEPVTYLAVGPVFDTSTKATGYSAVGLERVRYAARQVESRSDTAYEDPVGARPRRAHGVVAIGGMTLETAPLAIEAGATSVAVITDLLATGDPEARVRSYLVRLSQRGNV
jgi:thiamine-phosphate pyrophosphorylase